MTVTVVFAPFVASSLRPRGETAVAAVLAVTSAILLGVVDRTIGTSPHMIRVAAVTCGGALAVWLAVTRTRRQRRLRAVSRIAEIAQQAILHPLPAATRHLRLACAYRSATAEARIGGDFYGAVESPWGTRVIVGDVRGKGLDAVRLAAALLGEFRSRARSEPTLSDVVEHIEDAAEVVVGPEDFATAIVLEARDDGLELVRCGHPSPLLATRQDFGPLGLPGTLPFGLGADGKETATVALPHGSRLLLYSDGAIETRNAAGVEFDLEAAFAAVADLPGHEALDELIARLAAHGGGTIDDDVVLLLAEPAEAPGRSSPASPRRGAQPRPLDAGRRGNTSSGHR